MLEPLEADRSVEFGADAPVGDRVLLAPHVRLERVAVAPAADHEDPRRVRVGLPDLEVDEAVEVVDEARAAPEGGDERVRLLGLDVSEIELAL